MRDSSLTVEAPRSLEMAVLDAVPEPFAALDTHLCLMTASQSFYAVFGIDPAEALGRPVYSLGGGQLDIPALRILLETIIADRVEADAIEVEQDLAEAGHRVMRLNARKLHYGELGRPTILLACTDITEHRDFERHRTDLLTQASRHLREKDILLQEVQHRVGNSIQMLASMLRLQSRNVESEEARHHLTDAYMRVLSVGEVQSHLNEAVNYDDIEIAAYLTRLTAGLVASMVSERQPIAIEISSASGTITSSRAVNIGLVVTELVINAIKFAFPAYKADARISIAYEVQGPAWKLVVSDNGIGNGAGEAARSRGSLARTIVNALVRQLDARMIVSSGPDGLTVSILSPSWVTL